MNVVVDVYDKASGEKVASQTIKRVYTHFAESKSFASAGSMVLPEDTIGFSYEAEGGKGNSGTGASAQAFLLQVSSKACPTNYQPNSTGTACVACPAPSNWKQYRSGDCTLGTCATGKKANSAKTGCENIVCTGHTTLVGDECQTCLLTSDKQYFTATTGCATSTCPTGQIANAAKTGCEAITCPSGQVLEGDNCRDKDCSHTYRCIVKHSYGGEDNYSFMDVIVVKDGTGFKNYECPCLNNESDSACLNRCRTSCEEKYKTLC